MPCTTVRAVSKAFAPTGTAPITSCTCCRRSRILRASGVQPPSCGSSCPLPMTSSWAGHWSYCAAMVRDGIFVTPPVSADILEGITRTLLMGLVRDELGLEVVERSIDRTELYTCVELILCGTGAQVSPVIELDHRTIGSGVVGRHSR